MKKTWLILAASLVLIGCILFAGIMSTIGWDFTKLSTVSYETNTYEISEAFDGIVMNTNTADIELIFSEENNCNVVCHEEKQAKHSVSVENGTLVIEWMDNRPLYDWIGLNFSSPKITVYLPKTEYTNLLIHGDTSDIEIPDAFMFQDVDISLTTGDVDISASASEKMKMKTSTGDICAQNLSVGSLDLTVSTGDIYLTDIVCKSVISSGNTGDISLKNVIATEIFSIERSTGDVTFDRCDAAALLIKTDTGDVSGTLLSEKVFLTETDTGSIHVPASMTGGRCEITTNTGDIRIHRPS